MKQVADAAFPYLVGTLALLLAVVGHVRLWQIGRTARRAAEAAARAPRDAPPAPGWVIVSFLLDDGTQLPYKLTPGRPFYPDDPGVNRATLARRWSGILVETPDTFWHGD